MKNNANLAQARIDRAIKEEGDYYATHPSMVERFISRVSDKYELGKILEPACGGGHISMVLEDYLFEVESSDLFDRGFGHTGFNFLERTELFEGSIITNPPYSLADEFVKKAIEIQKGDRDNRNAISITVDNCSKKGLCLNHICRIYTSLEGARVAVKTETFPQY